MPMISWLFFNSAEFHVFASCSFAEMWLSFAFLCQPCAVSNESTISWLSGCIMELWEKCWNTLSSFKYFQKDMSIEGMFREYLKNREYLVPCVVFCSQTFSKHLCTSALGTCVFPRLFPRNVAPLVINVGMCWQRLWNISITCTLKLKLYLFRAAFHT